MTWNKNSKMSADIHLDWASISCCFISNSRQLILKHHALLFFSQLPQILVLDVVDFFYHSSCFFLVLTSHSEVIELLPAKLSYLWPSNSLAFSPSPVPARTWFTSRGQWAFSLHYEARVSRNYEDPGIQVLPRNSSSVRILWHIKTSSSV